MTITDNKKDIAYQICNTVGCADNYPQVYQAAYEIQYKGYLTHKTAKAIKNLQCDDVRKLGYVPKMLLAQLNSIIN